jgi:prepilin-type N-terminal cleavage/methylation domain-containing protein
MDTYFTRPYLADGCRVRNLFCYSGLKLQAAKGFSLVELLIALAVFSSVLGFLFASLGEGQNVSAISRDEAEMQQNLQDILTLMTSELRSTGFPPENYYDAQFSQNSSTNKNLIAKGLVEITPQAIKFQGDINGNGKVDFVHYYLSGSSAPYSLNRFGGEINNDGSLPGGSAQKLSEQVESLQFKYFTHSGLETLNLQDVVTIEIHLTMRTLRMDPFLGIYRTVSESTRIRPLNL